MKQPAKEPRRGGRPRLDAGTKKERKVQTRFDAAQFEAVRKRAKKAEMPISSFMREAALNARIIAPPSLENREAYRELGRVGQLFNQAMAAVHKGQITNVNPAVLNRVYREIQAVRRALMGVGQ